MYLLIWIYRDYRFKENLYGHGCYIRRKKKTTWKSIKKDCLVPIMYKVSMSNCPMYWHIARARICDFMHRIFMSYYRTSKSLTFEFTFHIMSSCDLIICFTSCVSLICKTYTCAIIALVLKYLKLHTLID